ncbi:MAG: FAD-binding protein [Oscillospiraceae bacterium]|nr:FAD-binding protein [Oscillospiraceae bacterium]
MDTLPVIIVGSGVAAYNAARVLHSLGVQNIQIRTEGRQAGTSRNAGSDKQTYYKLSLAGEGRDSVRDMARSFYAGGGVDGELALVMAAYSAQCFYTLVELGVPFPKNEYGEYVGYQTDHDSTNRATSAGPLTSRYMTEALEQAVLAADIDIIEKQSIAEIHQAHGHLTGLSFINTETEEIAFCPCRCGILATGGPANLYAESVYPKSQSGALGICAAAGLQLSNLHNWQYGIASLRPRWNLSGSYQQALPRYISIGADGGVSEFLPLYMTPEEAILFTFRKGYEWPFDPEKATASSRIDIAVHAEIHEKQRRVYLDYTQNPVGLAPDLSNLPPEVGSYLQNCNAIGNTPYRRLQSMNRAAIELYRSHALDLQTAPLEIAVCAQHCNGGVAVNAHWETSLPGLFAVGECAGTFGAKRPGGSALNAAMVGAYRAAERVAGGIAAAPPATALPSPPCNGNAVAPPGGNAAALRRELSAHAAFRRNAAEIHRMRGTYRRQRDALPPPKTLAELRIYDNLHAACAILSAMEAQESVPSMKNPITLTQGDTTVFREATPLPNPDTWFERVWAASQRS